MAQMRSQNCADSLQKDDRCGFRRYWDGVEMSVGVSASFETECGCYRETVGLGTGGEWREGPFAIICGQFAAICGLHFCQTIQHETAT